MIYSIPLIEITNFIVCYAKPKRPPHQKIVIWIPAYNAPAVNPSGIKLPLGNGLSKFFINGKQVFSNDTSSLQGNPPDCIILVVEFLIIWCYWQKSYEALTLD